MEDNIILTEQFSFKKRLTRVAVFLIVFEILIFLFNLIADILLLRFAPEFLHTQNGIYLLSIVPTYALAFPISYLVIKDLPTGVAEKKKIGVGSIIVYALIALGVMWVGSLLGNLVGSGIDLLIKGTPFSNPLSQLDGEASPVIAFLTLVVIGPLGEELVFRKLAFGRLLPLGERTAILLSSLFFGLYHSNFYQFFYGFLLGYVLAHVYNRSGNLLYPIIIHGIVNLFGAFIPLFIVPASDSLVDIILSSSYQLLELGCFIAGIVLLIINRKKAELRYSENNLRFGQSFKNAAVIGLIILYLATFVLNFFQ